LDKRIRDQTVRVVYFSPGILYKQNTWCCPHREKQIVRFKEIYDHAQHNKEIKNKKLVRLALFENALKYFGICLNWQSLSINYLFRNS